MIRINVIPENKAMVLNEITQCRLCADTRLSLVLSLAPTPVGDLYLSAERHPETLPLFPLDLNQCRACGHVQLKWFLDLGSLYADYIYTTSSSLGLAEHFHQYAKDVCERLNLAQGSLVVEMGSNDGTLLAAFKALGMKVVGIDPAREIAAQATSEGIPTYSSFFTRELARQIRAEHGAPSLFIANNVLANVPSPSAILEGIQEILPPEGVFVFETGYLRYLAEDCVFDNIYHEHIDYYSIKPLVSFCERFGMRLFDVEVTASKGSSIRCFVQWQAGLRPVSPQIQTLLEREAEKEYAGPGPYLRLAESLAETKRQLRTLLSGLRQQGKRIAGYGAAIGSTTILYHFDLAEFVPLLIDDNPVRQGRRSPGLALPVVDSAILNRPDAPDAVVILAWRYAGPIMLRNQSYSQRGGKFIRFLPTLACS